MRFTSFAVLGAAVALSACQQGEGPAAADAGTSPPAEAVTGQPAASRLEPRRGLWQITLDGSQGPMPAMCGTGENLEGLREMQAAASGGRLCNPDNPFRREGAAWVARTRCDLHTGGRSLTVMTITGDLNARFRVEIVNSFHDMPYEPRPGTRIAYTVERTGDC